MMLKTSLSVVLLFCCLCGAHSLGESADEQESGVSLQHPQDLGEGTDVQDSSTLQRSEGAQTGAERFIDSSCQLYMNLQDEVRELREAVSILRNQIEEQKRKGNNNSCHGTLCIGKLEDATTTLYLGSL